MKKRIKNIILIGFFIILLVSFGVMTYGYYWISDWNKISTQEEMKFNSKNLNDTKELPSNFYRVWDALFPDSRYVSMTQQSMGEFLYEVGLKKEWKDCKCDEIGYNSWNNHNYNWKYNFTTLLQTAGYRRFGFGLNKYSSPEKCFDFWVNNDFYYKLERRYFNDLNEFSIILNEKEIQELTDEEVIVLIAYRLMNSYPSPQENRFEEEKNKLDEIWKKASI